MIKKDFWQNANAELFIQPYYPNSYVLTPSFTAGGFQAAMLYGNSDVTFLSFLRPFKWRLWVSFLMLWLIFSLCLTFISYLSGKLPERDEQRFSFWDSVWYFSIVGFSLGVDGHPQSASGKTLTFAWSFFTLITVSTYTANLAAFFTKENNDRPLETISGEICADFEAIYSMVSWAFMGLDPRLSF